MGALEQARAHLVKAREFLEAAELARAGQTGKELESTFARLRGLKTTAQYQAASIARGEAVKAVEWATRMVDAAGQAVSS